MKMIFLFIGILMGLECLGQRPNSLKVLILAPLHVLDMESPRTLSVTRQWDRSSIAD